MGKKKKIQQNETSAAIELKTEEKAFKLEETEKKKVEETSYKQ